MLGRTWLAGGGRGGWLSEETGGAPGTLMILTGPEKLPELRTRSRRGWLELLGGTDLLDGPALEDYNEEQSTQDIPKTL